MSAVELVHGELEVERQKWVKCSSLWVWSTPFPFPFPFPLSIDFNKDVEQQSSGSDELEAFRSQL